MATTFNMLRANDLIWSFVVNNYLLGKEPFPFDLLYWNSRFHAHAGGDAQLLPPQHVPGEQAGRSRAASRSHGVPIDLGKIKVPSFLLSTKEDHIAPWQSTYAATQLYKGGVRFCSPPRATSRASSTRRARTNTATGRTTRSPRRRRRG